MSYDAYVNGEKIYPVSIRVAERISEPAEATIQLPGDPGFEMDDVVEIKRDGVLIFKGLVEAIGLDEGEEGLSSTVTARDYSCVLERTTVGDALYLDAEPADVIRSILAPTTELSEWFDQFSSNTLGQYGYNRGAWEIAYGLLHGIDGELGRFANLVTGSGSWGNCQIRATITPMKRVDGAVAEYAFVGPGIVARWQDANNFMAAYLCNKKAYLSRVSGGTETVVAEKDFGWEYGRTYVFRLRLSGAIASLWINEEPVFSAVNMGAIPSAGRAGLSTSGVEAFFDDFMIGLAGWSASASANSDYAVNAIDGDLNTVWAKQADQAQGDWFTLDLGSSKTFNRITVFHRKNHHARNWKLEVSTDGSNWTQVAAKSGETRQTVDVFLGSPVSARYIRMTLTASAFADWAIREFAVAKAEGDQILPIGRIDPSGQCISVAYKHENRLEAARRVAEIIGWELWAGADGGLYFAQAKGSDKSSIIKFEAGSNVLAIEEELDALEWATRIRLQGHGEWRDALEVVVQDDAQINKGVIREKTFFEQDLVGRESLQARALALLEQYKNPLRRLSAEVVDPGGWELGDKVRLIDPLLGLDEPLRVMEVEREWDEGGESVRISLQRPSPRAEDVLAQLKGAMARLTFYSPDPSMRYNAERLQGAYWFRFWSQQRRLGA